MAVTLLTFIAEIGGVALALELATSGATTCCGCRWSRPLVWLVLWRAKFSLDRERASGCCGLALVVFAVAAVAARARLGRPVARSDATAAKPAGESWPTYAYYAVALFGAAMTPYEVFFFSSGGVEERWTHEGPRRRCAPTCSSGSRSAACCRSPSPARTAVVLRPAGIEVDTLGQVGAAGRRRARQDRPRRRAARVLRGDVRRGLRDRALGRLQHRAVLRLAVGQVRAARPGRPVPR